MTWVLDLVRMLLSVFDRIVYGLIELFYTTFNLIAKTRVFTESTLEQFSNRIYIFLAIIMLFKLSFSIITYIINPDNFSNNEKGVGKLIQNVVLVLVLLVITPLIFNQAYLLQRIILQENIVGRIILGSSDTDIMDDDTIYKTMSFTVLNAFLKPNTQEIDALSENDRGEILCNGYSMPSLQEIANNKYASNKGGIDEGLDYVKCMNGLSNTVSTIRDDDGNLVSGVGVGATYVWAYKKQDYQLLINLINAKYVNDNDIYLFQYTYLISTIAGGFIAWIFLIFCFDIAVRSVKLSFLQLIAPVPIISCADPKSSKNGMFHKWYKTCLSTYADLFIRLVSIYFAVYIIKIISTSDQVYYVYGNDKPNAIIQVFIIIGALMFAKQVPKLIEDITGIKLSGKFELNPLKKFEDNALGGKRITSAIAGFATGGIAGAVAGRGIGRLGGLVSGGLRGAGSGFAGGQGMRATRDNLTRRRHAMEMANANGSTFGGRMRLGIENSLGLDNELDRIRAEEDRLSRDETQNANRLDEIDTRQANGRQNVDHYKQVTNKVKSMEERMKSQIESGAAGDISRRYFVRKQEIENAEQAMQTAINDGTLFGSNLDAENQRIADMKMDLSSWMEGSGQYRNHGAMDDYFDGIQNGTISDAALASAYSDYQALCEQYGETAATTASSIHSHAGRLKGQIGDIERNFIADNAAKEEINEAQRQIKEQRRVLKEQQRVAQANMDAVANRPPHGGGGRPH